MFDIHAIEKGSASDKMNVLTFQAMTDEDFEGWVSITGGQIHVTKPQLSSKIELQSNAPLRRKCRRIGRIGGRFREEMHSSDRESRCGRTGPLPSGWHAIESQLGGGRTLR